MKIYYVVYPEEHNRTYAFLNQLPHEDEDFDLIGTFEADPKLWEDFAAAQATERRIGHKLCELFKQTKECTRS